MIDLPRMSLLGIHSENSLSRVDVKSVQSSSADFFFQMVSQNLDLSLGQSALRKTKTLRGFCLCWVGFRSASAETRS